MSTFLRGPTLAQKSRIETVNAKSKLKNVKFPFRNYDGLSEPGFTSVLLLEIGMF